MKKNVQCCKYNYYLILIFSFMTVFMTGCIKKPFHLKNKGYNLKVMEQILTTTNLNSEKALIKAEEALHVAEEANERAKHLELNKF